MRLRTSVKTAPIFPLNSAFTSPLPRAHSSVSRSDAGVSKVAEPISPPSQRGSEQLRLPGELVSRLRNRRHRSAMLRTVNAYEGRIEQEGLQAKSVACGAEARMLLLLDGLQSLQSTWC